MKRVYPVILTQDKNEWLVYIPDFDVNTQGNNLENAIEMARDAIGISGISMQDIGQTIPEPKTLQPIHNETELVALIDIDFGEYRRKNEQKTVKKNCTLPSWLNYEAEKANINFSAVLQTALKRELQINE